MTLYNHQIRERKEYPDSGGKSVITVGEKQGGFVVFEIQEYNHDNTEIKQHRTVEIRYVGESRPESALQVDVSVTKWNWKGRPHTTYASFSLPADMVEKWIAPMMPAQAQQEATQ
jgi:hypothetical protein